MAVSIAIKNFAHATEVLCKLSTEEAAKLNKLVSLNRSYANDSHHFIMSATCIRSFHTEMGNQEIIDIHPNAYNHFDYCENKVTIVLGFVEIVRS